MKTLTKTLFASLFAVTFSETAFADDYPNAVCVDPGFYPGFTQPSLELEGHFHPGEGMHVDELIYGGLAQRIGLEPGDMIVAINGQRIECEHHYDELLQEAVSCHGGHARLRVRNVRGYPLYVTLDACLCVSSGDGGGVIPGGPSVIPGGDGVNPGGAGVTWSFMTVVNQTQQTLRYRLVVPAVGDEITQAYWGGMIFSLEAGGSAGHVLPAGTYLQAVEAFGIPATAVIPVELNATHCAIQVPVGAAGSSGPVYTVVWVIQ